MFLICGETLFDFFETKGNASAATYEARIGGSPFNVALGLARLGIDVSLFSGVSTDLFGERIMTTLKDEGVKDWAITRFDAPTTLSFVGVDAEGSPSYVFLGENAADRALTTPPTLPASIEGLHFGSYSLVAAPTGTAQRSLASDNADRFISLDPNIRPTIEPDMNVWRNRVQSYLPVTNLVKVSAEDLGLLYPDKSTEDVAQSWLAQGPNMVVVTDGGASVTAYGDGGSLTHQVKPVKVVDAVGAGDTFMAALLFGLGEGGDPLNTLTSLTADDIRTILDFASRAAAITVSRVGADLPRLAELA